MTPEQPLRGNVVLTVDDDADSVAALERLIADVFGCRVLTASSGDEALRLIDSGLHVDLVFADVVMPEMDGLTLAHLIGRRLDGLPVVLVTGRSDVVDSVTDRGGIALLKPTEHLSFDRQFPASDLRLRRIRRPLRKQAGDFTPVDAFAQARSKGWVVEKDPLPRQ